MSFQATDLSGAGWLRLHTMERWLRKVRDDGAQPILLDGTRFASVRQAQAERQKADHGRRIEGALAGVARAAGVPTR